MKILLCVVSVAFGILSMIASVSQMKNEKKPFSAILMALGSLVLLAAVICSISAQPFDYILALLGCLAMCAAAIWNGIKSKSFHIQHHIIRILLSLLLIIGFAFL